MRFLRGYGIWIGFYLLSAGVALGNHMWLRAEDQDRLQRAGAFLDHQGYKHLQLSTRTYPCGDRDSRCVSYTGTDAQGADREGLCIQDSNGNFRRFQAP